MPGVAELPKLFLYSPKGAGISCREEKDMWEWLFQVWDEGKASLPEASSQGAPWECPEEGGEGSLKT